MTSPELPHFSSFDRVDPQDIADFALLTGPSQQFSRGSYLRMQGSASPDVYLLREGWIASSLTARKGRRQIVKIHMPGDLVGMPSLASSEAVETLQALTTTEVAKIPLDTFARIFRQHPRLAAMLFLMAQEERVHLMKRLASVGSTQSIRRIAALIISLHGRVFLGHADKGSSFVAPLTQADLADATGMSIVQANRSLRDLRVRGIVSWKDKVIDILDLPRLAGLADFPMEHRRSTRWLNNL